MRRKKSKLKKKYCDTVLDPFGPRSGFTISDGGSEDPDPDPPFRKGGSKDPDLDLLFPNVDPWIQDPQCWSKVIASHATFSVVLDISVYQMCFRTHYTHTKNILNIMNFNKMGF